MKMLWRMSLASAVIVSGPTMATARGSDGSIKNLPTEISGKCKTPIYWLEVESDHSVIFQPSSEAPNEKINCVLSEIKKLDGGMEFGSIGNDFDPNEVINPPWSYIAGGKIAVLEALAMEIKDAGWVLGSLAKADDGTGFLLFRTPDGITAAQAKPFNERIWKQQLGDITFGTAPTKTGGRLIEDE